MSKTQKIKSLIITLVLVVVISSLGFFANLINPKIYSGILSKGKILSTHKSTIVHFISVGQGDAIAINLPDGKVAVIDTGLKNSNVNFTNYLSEKVVNTSKNKKIDYLILTHADVDHTGGALRLIQEFKVANVVLPVISSGSEYYTNLLKMITEKEINTLDVFENSKLSGKNYDFQFFMPFGSASTNDMSHVVKLTTFKKSFLFAGDISSTIEKQLVENYGSTLDCDVLKIPHHGSKYSSSELFLNTVTPKISVICCGVNSYGHPTSEAIENITATGSKIYRTDENGDMVIATGEYYNLKLLNKNYKTIDMSFEIEIFILVIDFVFLIDAIFVFFRKERKRVK